MARTLRRVKGETHSRLVDGERQHFMTERLWSLAEGLPVVEVPIADIAEFDQDCWFRGVAPTCRQVAQHAQRIQAADLGHPVILSSSGALMDVATGSQKRGLLARARSVPIVSQSTQILTGPSPSKGQLGHSLASLDPSGEQAGR